MSQSIDREKRERKPKVSFSPEDHRIKKRLRQKKLQPDRIRNKAIDGTEINKWVNYFKIIKRLVMDLSKNLHTLEVYRIQGPEPRKAKVNSLGTTSSNLSEQDRIEIRIFQCKKAIISTLEALDEENMEHKQWNQLCNADEDDLVSVSEIMCSVCNGEEEEGNDILFCDRLGCYRAYHQMCLHPKLVSLNCADALNSGANEMDSTWFCWKCECLDDCLDFIGDVLGPENDVFDWRKLFPDVKSSQSNLDNDCKGCDTLGGMILADDEEEEGDEEYLVEEDSDGNNESNDGSSDDDDDSDSSSSGSGENIDEDNADEPVRVDSDSDDKNENSDPDSDTDSDTIEEDELAGLLQDANVEYNPMIALGSAGPSRVLRPRREQKSISDDIVIEGSSDVGKSVALVKKGVYVCGLIVAYENSTASEGNETEFWLARFDDDTEKKLERLEFRAALLLHKEYLERFQAQEAKRQERERNRDSIQSLVANNGMLDTGNVVEGKRSRGSVDYIELSLQMFGSLRDAEDDCEEGWEQDEIGITGIFDSEGINLDDFDSYEPGKGKRSKVGKTRKRKFSKSDIVESPGVKNRGRPRKISNQTASAGASPHSQRSDSLTPMKIKNRRLSKSDTVESPGGKKRGRPRKISNPTSDSASAGASPQTDRNERRLSKSDTVESSGVKKRGRPRKISNQTSDSATDTLSRSGPYSPTAKSDYCDSEIIFSAINSPDIEKDGCSTFVSNMDFRINTS